MWSIITSEFNKLISVIDLEEILILINEVLQESILIKVPNNSRHTERSHVKVEVK